MNDSKKKKHPGGRPTKYKPEFCELVIELGKQGCWLAEMADACDVHRSSMDEWASVHPEFSEALRRAKQYSQSWYEKTGREAMFLDKFNGNLWVKQMQARFREEYTERREVDNTSSDGSMTPTVIERVVVMPKK